MVWTYCPECGSDKIHHHEGIHKQCVCGQEWFSDMDYTDVVRTHLSGAYSDKDAEIARLTAALAAAEARGYARGLEDANRSHLKTGGECECGLSGPCMQENCRSPILRALAKKEAGE